MEPIYLYLELIQCAFWVQNGKNEGFTKMSQELWKLYIVRPSSCWFELVIPDRILTLFKIILFFPYIVTPSAKRDEAIASRIQFTTTEGDHITLLKIFRAFKQCKNEREFAQAHYLNLRHMQFAAEVRKQLMEMCRRNQIPVRFFLF